MQKRYFFWECTRIYVLIAKNNRPMGMFQLVKKPLRKTFLPPRLNIQ